MSCYIVFFSSQFAWQGHPWTVAIIQYTKERLECVTTCFVRTNVTWLKRTQEWYLSSFQGWIFLSILTKNAFQKAFQWHPVLEADAPPPLCNLLYRCVVIIMFDLLWKGVPKLSFLSGVTLPLSMLSKDPVMLGAPDITSPFAQGRFFTAPSHWAMLKWSHHPRWMRILHLGWPGCLLCPRGYPWCPAPLFQRMTIEHPLPLEKIWNNDIPSTLWPARCWVQWRKCIHATWLAEGDPSQTLDFRPTGWTRYLYQVYPSLRSYVCNKNISMHVEIYNYDTCVGIIRNTHSRRLYDPTQHSELDHQVERMDMRTAEQSVDW